MTGAFVMALGIVWAATLIAHSNKPVFIYLLKAYSYFTPGIATMFLLGILWRRTTQAGALAAGALTIPLSAFLQMIAGHLSRPGVVEHLSLPYRLLIPFYNRTGIVFWACVLVAVVVSLCTKPKPAHELEGLIWNKASLTLPKEQRAMMRGLRNPAIWWALVTAAVLSMFIKYH